MKKALIVATASSFITGFELNDVKILQELGYEVHIASNKNINEHEDTKIIVENNKLISHQIDFERSPFTYKNIKAYKQLKEVVKNNNFDVIHCHTPVGGVLARLVAKSVKQKQLKIIYTVHGFHFYKGNNFLENLFFKSVEKYVAKYTDCIITINGEDYKAAQNFKLKHGGKVYKINGIGININKYKENNINITAKKEELGLKSDDIILMSVGELSDRKNQQIIIKALNIIKNPKIHYFIAGEGLLKANLVKLSESLGLKEQVHFIGYRNDVNELLKITDIFCFPSLQEGLPVALMEAMASGLPIVASKIRGNTDLIDEYLGGYLIDRYSFKDFAKSINCLLQNSDIKKEYGQYNKKKITTYSIEDIGKEMKNIYLNILG